MESPVVSGWSNYPGALGAGYRCEKHDRWYHNVCHYCDVDERAAELAAVDKHKGWTITQEAEYGGLMVVRRPDGTKYGHTQTEAGAKIMRRRAIERESRDV